MAWSFSVPACPLDEFARRAQTAQQDAASGMNDIEAAQSARLVEFAILAAQEGYVGPDWVGAELSGHANADHQPKVGKGDSHCSFAVFQAGPRD